MPDESLPDESWMPMREPMTWSWKPLEVVEHAKGDAARWGLRQEAPPPELRWLGEEPRPTRRPVT